MAVSASARLDLCKAPQQTAELNMSHCSARFNQRVLVTNHKKSESAEH